LVLTLLSQRKKARPFRSALLVLLLGGIAAGAFFLQKELRLPAPARLELTTDLPGIGRKTMITIKATEPRLGLARVVVTASGAGFARRVVGQRGPTPEGGAGEVVVHIPFGREPTPEIRPGTLTLEVTAQARGTRLRQPEPVTLRRSLEVKLHPPAIAALSSFIHPAQGGAEVVVYHVGPTSKRDGVEVGNWFFPGFPRPGGPPDQRFALFAIPYDLEVGQTEALSRILLVAEDDLGNRASAQFIHQYLRRPMGRDVIELEEGFMKKVTDEIYARTPEITRRGTLLEDFLQLNRELRARNMAALLALAQKTQRQFLWSDTFLPMANAAVKGSFADRRTYLAGGKQVDVQDHLGFDLASLQQAMVPAANAGVVLLAEYFGIFGNAVVVDHGYGLMSLYAHLSTVVVKPGDRLGRGEALGRTGGTGLAGGDHLHFTLLVHGLPVTPLEWWDSHWIQDRLKLKLGDALPWKPASSR
jgi:murein DD-endopeptidase MepM/ murein hydrolase activator NlpD